MQWVTTLESVDYPSNRRQQMPIMGLFLTLESQREILAEHIKTLILERLAELPKLDQSELRMRIWVRSEKLVPAESVRVELPGAILAEAAQPPPPEAQKLESAKAPPKKKRSSRTESASSAK